MHIAMLLFPRMTQLDLTGPYEVFSRFPETTVDLVAATPEPVSAGGGMRIVPTVTLDACPATDVLFVPGGPGQADLMADAATLGFLARQGAAARYVTSVCTGSLLLAAAGLLTGYRATCHWLSLGQLAYFGAEPVAERVVVDRNRVTGAGVTSGLDFALTLMALIHGDERARLTQLAIEYDPAPPFPGGSPATAAADDVARLRAMTAVFQTERDAIARAAAARLTPGHTTAPAD
jgi:cyclohexyl-isocyanide hydratase